MAVQQTAWTRFRGGSTSATGQRVGFQGFSWLPVRFHPVAARSNTGKQFGRGASMNANEKLLATNPDPNSKPVSFPLPAVHIGALALSSGGTGYQYSGETSPVHFGNFVKSAPVSPNTVMDTLKHLFGLARADAAAAGAKKDHVRQAALNAAPVSVGDKLALKGGSIWNFGRQDSTVHGDRPPEAGTGRGGSVLAGAIGLASVPPGDFSPAGLEYKPAVRSNTRK